MADKDVQELAGVAVVDVDFAVARAGEDEVLGRAAEAGAHDKVALIVAFEAAEDRAVFELQVEDLLSSGGLVSAAFESEFGCRSYLRRMADDGVPRIASDSDRRQLLRLDELAVRRTKPSATAQRTESELNSLDQLALATHLRPANRQPEHANPLLMPRTKTHLTLPVPIRVCVRVRRRLAPTRQATRDEVRFSRICSADADKL